MIKLSAAWSAVSTHCVHTPKSLSPLSLSFSVHSLLFSISTDGFWDEDVLRWDLNVLVHKHTLNTQRLRSNALFFLFLTILFCKTNFHLSSVAINFFFSSVFVLLWLFLKPSTGHTSAIFHMLRGLPPSIYSCTSIQQ